jgi:predicted anti-sigma-YlaC factor YlaD
MMSQMLKVVAVLSLVAGLFVTLSKATAHDVNSTQYVESRTHSLHFAVSYGVTLTSYMLLRRAGMPAFPAGLLSMVVVNCLGAVKEMNDQHGADGRSVLMNGLGSGAAVGTAVLLSF